MPYRTTFIVTATVIASCKSEDASPHFIHVNLSKNKTVRHRTVHILVEKKKAHSAIPYVMTMLVSDRSPIHTQLLPFTAIYYCYICEQLLTNVVIK